MREWLLSVGVLVGCATSHPQTTTWQPPPRADVAIAVGDRAPEVVPAKVTLVVFWATWSAPGKMACAQVETIWQKRKEKGLAVKSVSIDDEPTGLDEFKKSNGMTYSVEWDRGHRLANLYRVAHEPTLYVVDRAGIVRFIHAGWHGDEASQVADEADSLL
jgi:peroxiredoxin